MKTRNKWLTKLENAKGTRRAEQIFTAMSRSVVRASEHQHRNWILSRKYRAQEAARAKALAANEVVA